MGIIASSSSSTSSALPSKKYDVFISFRGDNTRTNFTSHLYTALCSNKIEIYIDYRLHKGDEISSALTQAIKDSTISLVMCESKKAFAKHEKAFRRNIEVVNNWRNALFQTSNLAGWDSQTCRDESELIQNIVSDVLRKLNNSHPFELKDLLG
ncbi:hypothetical protein K1719_009295 [Acacia pycnantha]|nr:hypothetical protein K1719_009295 [Acacia pycnantha]